MVTPHFFRGHDASCIIFYLLFGVIIIIFIITENYRILQLNKIFTYASIFNNIFVTPVFRGKVY